MCNFFQGEKTPVLQQALSSIVISKLCSEVSYRLDLEDILGGKSVYASICILHYHIETLT